MRTQNKEANNGAQIRILAVDDHPIVLDGIELMIRTQEDMVMSGKAYRATEALHMIPSIRPDVVLMDLNLPDISGIMTTKTIRHTYPSTRVLILTTYCREEDVRGAIEAGANGYILKEALRNEMIAAIRVVYNGDEYLPAEMAARLGESMGREPLTQREREVLAHASNGLLNDDIAKTLKIGRATVKSHMKSIYSKFGVGDRTQAILTALRRGLIHPE